MNCTSDPAPIRPCRSWALNAPGGRTATSTRTRDQDQRIADPTQCFFLFHSNPHAVKRGPPHSITPRPAVFPSRGPGGARGTPRPARAAMTLLPSPFSPRRGSTARDPVPDVVAEVHRCPQARVLRSTVRVPMFHRNPSKSAPPAQSPAGFAEADDHGLRHDHLRCGN